MNMRVSSSGVINSINMQSLNGDSESNRGSAVNNVDRFVLDDSLSLGRISRRVDSCEAINCDEDLCNTICDKICEVVCDNICDEWCDGVCDKICDEWCDMVV